MHLLRKPFVISTRWYAALTGIVIIAAAPGPASAAEPPRWDLSGGYSLVLDNDIADEGSLPYGWFASVDVAISRFVAIVGDVSANYTTVTSTAGDAHLRVYTYTGGAKLLARDAATTPFAEVLVGMARTRADVVAFPELNARFNNFLIQPGGGVDIAVTHKLKVRTGARVRFIRATFGTSKQLQIFGGIVID